MFHASVYAQRKKAKGLENRFQKKPQLDLFQQFLFFYFLVENSSLTKCHNFWFVRLNFENSTVPKNDFENGFLSLSTFTSPQNYWLRFFHENFIQHLSFCPVKSIAFAAWIGPLKRKWMQFWLSSILNFMYFQKLRLPSSVKWRLSTSKTLLDSETKDFAPWFGVVINKKSKEEQMVVVFLHLQTKFSPKKRAVFPIKVWSNNSLKQRSIGWSKSQFCQCMAIVTGSKCKNVLLRLNSLEMQTYNFTRLLTWCFLARFYLKAFGSKKLVYHIYIYFDFLPWKPYDKKMSKITKKFWMFLLFIHKFLKTARHILPTKSQLPCYHWLKLVRWKTWKICRIHGSLDEQKGRKKRDKQWEFWRSTYVSAKTTGLVSSMNLKRVFMVKDKHLSAKILLCCKHRTWKISISPFSKKTSFCIPSIPQRQPCICGSGMNTETTGSLHCSGGHKSLTCHKLRIPLIILCKEVNFLWNPEISGLISGIKPSFDNCLPV